MTDTTDAPTRRGNESRTYYYVALAIILSFESSAILILGLGGWRGLAIHIFVFAITVWLFLTNGWVHNKLTGFKAQYEARFR